MRFRERLAKPKRTNASSLSMLLVGLLVASSLGVLLAVPSVSVGSTGPTISSVTFSLNSGTYTVTVNGTGFGSLPKSLPFTGDTGYFRIGDAAQTGSSEWGYNGDGKTLTYDSWTDTQIVVSGFGGSAGDAVVMALWNPTTNIGVTWGGNVPPIPKAPQITSVTFSGSGQTTSMTIVGSGFGSAPASMPFTGDLNYFHFLDFRAPCGASSSEFGAGFNGWGIVPSEGVTVTFGSWSNTIIQISGFEGTYGQGCATTILGDPVSIYIWSTSDSAVTGPQTAWGGILSTTTPTTTTTTKTTTTSTTTTLTQTVVSTTSLISTTTSPTTTTTTLTSPTTLTTTAISPTTTSTTTTLTQTVVSTTTSSISTTHFPASISPLEGVLLTGVIGALTAAAVEFGRKEPIPATVALIVSYAFLLTLLFVAV